MISGVAHPVPFFCGAAFYARSLRVKQCLCPKSQVAAGPAFCTEGTLCRYGRTQPGGRLS